MKEPDKEFLRWADVIEWLGSQGISERQIRNLIKMGKIAKGKLYGKGRAYYSKTQIKKDILNDQR